MDVLEFMVQQRDEEGSPWYISTTELQMASLSACVEVRRHQPIRVRVTSETPQAWYKAAAPPVSRSNESEFPVRKRSRVPDMKVASVAWAENRPIVDLEKFKPTIKEIIFESPYNQPIVGLPWPCQLEKLSFAGNVNKPLLASELYRYHAFNQPVVDVIWPPRLRQLAFGFRFDQPVEGAAWPSNLKQLQFGHEFDQKIHRSIWPDSLEQLEFGFDFSQDVDGVLWPASLRKLTFGEEFTPRVGIVWPSSLETVTRAGVSLLDNPAA